MQPNLTSERMTQDPSIEKPRWVPAFPLCSTTHQHSTLKIHFELGKPFKPFEQLLAVLPAASKNLLPACYQVGFRIKCICVLFNI